MPKKLGSWPFASLYGIDEEWFQLINECVASAIGLSAPDYKG
jgi:hypothetical protein